MRQIQKDKQGLYKQKKVQLHVTYDGIWGTIVVILGAFSEQAPRAPNALYMPTGSLLRLLVAIRTLIRACSLQRHDHIR